MPSLATYGVLALAILSEVIGTSALQASQQFTRPIPTIIMAVSYLLAFYLLSLALKTIPIGIAYAMWSGVGIIFISVIGFVVFKQKLDLPAMIGIGLIVAGVVLVNGVSSTSSH